MEAEHCSYPSSCFEFHTANYGIITTPDREWNIVACKALCAEEHRHHDRQIPDVDTLVASRAAVAAGLRREEIIALVLYTGPMVRVAYSNNAECMQTGRSSLMFVTFTSFPE
jgi:alkylhydroperoxidase/carboxymuconolactone decarboxylase family protein YurZ